MKIDVDEIETLSCYYQTVLTIRSYLERMARDGNDSVSVSLMSILAGCSDRVDKIRKEADDGK